MRENWAGHDDSRWPPQEWNARNSQCTETARCRDASWQWSSVAAVCAAARHANGFRCAQERAHELVLNLRADPLRVKSRRLQKFARFFHLVNARRLHFNGVESRRIQLFHVFGFL